MFLSRIWFVLVCLVAGVALTSAFVAQRSASRQLGSIEGEGLDRAQYAAEQMLKTDAHRWINYVAKLGRDAVITEALDSATRSAGEPRMLNETVRGRLQALVPDRGGIGIEYLVALDGKGKVVARVGEKEGEFGDSLAGAEIVADGMRGYMSDDVWVQGERLLRVAAAPVLAKTRDRVVGVVFVAAETSKRLTEVWKKNLGVDVAIVLRNEVLTSTLGEGSLATLPQEIDGRRKEIETAKRTRAFTLPLGNDQLLAVAAPFTGEAAELKATYVLLQPRTLAGDPFTLLANSTKQDLSFATFPWLRLVGALAAMLLVGLWLQSHEMSGPLLRLRKEIQRLAKGEIPKVDDGKHPGHFGGIARDVNATLERFTHGQPPASETAGKDLNAILGSDPRPPSRNFELPSVPSFSSPPSGAGFPSPPSSGGFAPVPTPTGPGASAFSPASSMTPITSPPSSPGIGAMPSARLSSPPIPASRPPAGPPPAFAPPAPPSRPAAAPPSFGGAFGAASTPTPVVPGPMPGGLLGAAGSTPVGSAPSYPAAAPRPPAPASRPMATPSPAAPLAGEMDDETTANLAEVPTSKEPVAQSEEQHMREVFEEYVATRQKCGESTTGLTLEKFRTKLEANKQQLIAKYGCRSAKFSVYVKDGKAAIKAAPVR